MPHQFGESKKYGCGPPRAAAFFSSVGKANDVPFFWTTEKNLSLLTEVYRAILWTRNLMVVDFFSAIVLPGVVTLRNGRVLGSPYLTVRQSPHRCAMADRPDLSVVIDNDANHVAVAELWFGRGRSRSDFTALTIEHVFRMGMVRNQRLYGGAKGLGTEMAHRSVQLDAALCRCGQIGCLEGYAASNDLMQGARTTLNLGGREVTSPRVLLKLLHEYAKSGNQSAQAIFNRAGRYLARGLAKAINLFDPLFVLLWGERTRNDDTYAEEVMSAMQKMIVHAGAPYVEIHVREKLIRFRGRAALSLDASTEAELAVKAVAA